MTENEFALECIPLLSGLLLPEPHVFLAEVPRRSHNDHTDMLCIFPNVGTMINFEFKIGNLKNHKRQIHRTHDVTGIPTIGINPELKATEIIKIGYRQIIAGWKHDEFVWDNLYLELKSYWKLKIGHYQDTPKSRLYWWGYHHEIMACRKEFKKPDPLESGLSQIGKASTERITLHQLYIRACGNIFQENGNHVMPFEFVYPIIGIGNYSEITARKWYRAAVVKYGNSK